MSVTRRTRFEVLRRDDFTCRYCRSKDNELTVDHVIPVALGGNDAPSNLVAACKDCNSGKSSAAPDQAQVEEVADDALRWARAMRTAMDLRLLEVRAEIDYWDQFESAWNIWTVRGDPLPLPQDWRGSLSRWNELGVPMEIIEHAITTTMGRSKIKNAEAFRYFAGIIWRTLDAAGTRLAGVS